MLRSRIIPCLLIHDGGLVKTRRFASPKYIGDPLNVVKIFNEKEVDELIVFDIDAAAKARPPNMAVLKTLAIESRMPLCYGGGISSASQALQIISLGYEKVSISSAALERPGLISEIAKAIGSQSVVVTIDVRKNRFLPGYTVYSINGKTKHTVDLIDFCCQAIELGAGEIAINSIDRDGEMIGYDLALAQMVRQAVSSPLSILGGAGDTNDMQSLIDSVGVVGAAAGSMFVFKGQYRAVLVTYARPERLA